MLHFAPVSRARSVAWLALSAILLGLGCTRLPAPPPPAQPRVVPPARAPRSPLGEVRGRLLPPPDEELSASRPVVVFADPLGRGAVPASPPDARRVRRVGNGFAPDFVVVGVGQPVAFSDRGDLHHRLFSYSEPNDFQLEISPRRSGRVVFQKSGVVRYYCSLHAWERGVVFVAPSPWFDTARSDGRYALGALPPGRYRLVAWSESAASAGVAVTVRAGRATSVEIPLETRRDDG